MTDSHADFFLRNQLVILAEQRMLVAAVEPGAMVKTTLGVAPAGSVPGREEVTNPDERADHHR